jgi:MacB-like periplasmic core domain
LPYAHPSELEQIRTELPKFEPSNSHWAHWNDAQETPRRPRTFASAAVYRNEMFNLAGNGPTPPEALYGLFMTANLFPTLGVSPMLGRNILPDEDLETIGTRLLQGRWLNQEDMNDSSDSAIVSEFVAERLWPGESAIGKSVWVFCSPENPNNWKRVVGVVPNSRHASMDGSQQKATVYLAAGALHKAVLCLWHIRFHGGRIRSMQNPTRLFTSKSFATQGHHWICLRGSAGRQPTCEYDDKHHNTGNGA